MEVKLVLVGKAKDVFPIIKQLAEEEERISPEAALEAMRAKPQQTARPKLCLFCGTDLDVEREVFGPDKKHSCRGPAEADHLRQAMARLTDMGRFTIKELYEKGK